MVGTSGVSNLFTPVQNSGSVFTAKPAAAKSATPTAAAGGVEDAVSFSKVALAALKSGAPLAAKAPASYAPASYAPAAHAPVATATTSAPPLLKVEGGLETVDFKQLQRMSDLLMGHMDDQREFFGQRNDALRSSFGLPTDIELGGGLMLSGAIGDAIDGWMAANGTARPEKPAELVAWEKARASDDPGSAQPPGTARTSMITLFLPGSQGTGSEQVEIWIDNQAFEKLASLSADEVKAGLMDLMTGGAKADSVNKAIADGPFGQFMTENAAYHPEFSRPNARLAFTDPAGGDHPLLMIQSESRPDHVMKNADRLVDAVMDILKAAYPQAGEG